MESSNESFLWTDASNDSGDSKQNRSVYSMENQDNEKEFESDYKYKRNIESSGESEKQTKRKKKRKCSEAAQDSSEYSQCDSQQIKLEAESDLDIGSKGILKKESKTHNNTKDSILYDEEYLNLRVKEEQSSVTLTPKKKKHSKSTSNIDNAFESEKEGYLAKRVKEEQVSLIEPDNLIYKKKKKHNTSNVSSNTKVADEENILKKQSEDYAQNKLPEVNDNINYYVTKEKITVEETVIEKPQKKKHKKDALIKNNGDSNSIHEKKNIISVDADSDNFNGNENDNSLEPSEFTCTNIVSSTIINSSAIDLIDKKNVNETEGVLKSNKNIKTAKVSNRKTFLNDSIQKELDSMKASNKISMFLKVNPHLKLCAQERLNFNLISKDDETWILTWPHEIDLERLRNTTVFSEGKCKIRIEKQTYEGVLNEDVKGITLLTQQPGNVSVTNLAVDKCINFHKRIPKVYIPDNNIMINKQTNFTPLPETKCRHPLFGANYRKAIKIPTATSERLQSAKGRSSQSPSTTTKKKKHKKEKHKSIKSKLEDSDVDMKCEPSKKRKKRKYSEDDNVPAKKLKYSKHIADSPAVWECEKTIEENLFNF